MDADLIARIEQAIERQNRLIAGQARRLSATNRLLHAAILIGARTAADPVRYLDDLRAHAQDPLHEGLADVKDDLERALAALQRRAFGKR